MGNLHFQINDFEIAFKWYKLTL